LPTDGVGLRDHAAARLGHPRADLVDLIGHVHPVAHGVLVRVLADHVLVEEGVGVLGGRGGQADERGVEVLEHLAPQRVDGAVALVHHHHVEELGRQRAAL
jgi:hypothetical protein